MKQRFAVLGLIDSQGSREKLSFSLCKFGMLSINNKHVMDPNRDINYHRKIAPL